MNAVTLVVLGRRERDGSPSRSMTKEKVRKRGVELK
jgi:hypothetical protein